MADLVDQYPDGVFCVELAPIFDPSLVARTIAETLGATDAAGRPDLDVLVGHLRGQRLLLRRRHRPQKHRPSQMADGFVSASPVEQG